MTDFIMHRANALNQANLPVGFSGAEIDLRFHHGQLVLAHDPLMGGISLEEWLSNFNGNILILNAKETGIEEEAANVVTSLLPDVEYFFLDLPIPSIIKSINNKIPVAVRVSELEPISICHKLSANWIWLDSFFGDWSHLNEISALQEVEKKSLFGFTRITKSMARIA